MVPEGTYPISILRIRVVVFIGDEFESLRDLVVINMHSRPRYTGPRYTGNLAVLDVQLAPPKFHLLYRTAIQILNRTPSMTQD